MLISPIKAWLAVACILTSTVTIAADTSKCYTYHGPSSYSPVPTSWHTHYTSCTVTRFSTSVVSTHLPGPTVTTTTTVTSTISTTTVTVATSSGFLPVSSTFPDGPPYNGTVESQPAQKREAEPENLPRSTTSGKLYGSIGKPQSVGCNVWSGRNCITTTKTITHTSFLGPTLSTKTVTTTTTTALTTTTYYAACATNNFVYLNDIEAQNTADNNDQIAQSTASSPYDCCVAGLAFAQISLNSTVVNFSYEVSPQEGVCLVFYLNDGPPTCVGGQTAHEFEAVEYPGSYFTFLTGNTNCGEIVD